ncbi:MAG: hypothetical protein RL701_4076, partial [Pseudomonadota bacterium]
YIWRTRDRRLHHVETPAAVGQCGGSYQVVPAGSFSANGMLIDLNTPVR